LTVCADSRMDDRSEACRRAFMQGGAQGSASVPRHRRGVYCRRRTARARRGRGGARTGDSRGIQYLLSTARRWLLVRLQPVAEVPSITGEVSPTTITSGFPLRRPVGRRPPAARPGRGCGEISRNRPTTPEPASETRRGSFRSSLRITTSRWRRADSEDVHRGLDFGIPPNDAQRAVRCCVRSACRCHARDPMEPLFAIQCSSSPRNGAGILEADVSTEAAITDPCGKVECP
jgi:hypothetical protein